MDPFLPPLNQFIEGLSGIIPGEKPRQFALYASAVKRAARDPKQLDLIKQGYSRLISDCPQFYSAEGLVSLPKNYCVCYGPHTKISIPLQKIVEMNLSDPETLKSISDFLVVLAVIIEPTSVPEERLASVSNPGQPEMPEGVQNIFKAISDKMSKLPPSPEGEKPIRGFQRVLSEVVMMDEFGDLLELLVGKMEGGELDQTVAQNPTLANLAAMLPQMMGGMSQAPQG